MQSPVYNPLYADRYNPLIFTLTFTGKDVTGCTLHGQIRPKVNATTGSVVNLASAATLTDTGFWIISAGTVGGVAQSVVRVCVRPEDIAQFISAEDTDDVTARYEIKITEADGFSESVWMYGPLVIRAGVDNA